MNKLLKTLAGSFAILVSIPISAQLSLFFLPPDIAICSEHPTLCTPHDDELLVNIPGYFAQPLEPDTDTSVEHFATAETNGTRLFDWKS